ncbi:transporter [Agrobacterium sp. NPDC090283]|uniref:transporter n=1 Tax=Agrobacterium sp. NPDC090283 TaxID=3363920 RepID=UPI00383A1515
MRKLKLALSGKFILFCGLAGTANALDIQPYDVLPAPPGTAAWTTYIFYGKSNTAYLNGDEVGGDLKTLSVSQRLTYYFDILGHPALITGIVPYVDLRDANLAGVPLNDTNGIGDTTLAFTYWLYSDTNTNRHLDITAYLGIPTGKYEPVDALNAGSNRTSYALQLNGAYGLGSDWLLEGSMDVSFYRDNTNSGGAGDVLEQDPTYSAQLWLSYAATPQLSFSAGWGGFWGGEQKLNGIANGFDSDRQQLRAAVSWWINPTLQVLGQVNRDFEVKGGFEADTSFLLRISKLF